MCVTQSQRLRRARQLHPDSESYGRLLDLKIDELKTCPVTMQKTRATLRGSGALATQATQLSITIIYSVLDTTKLPAYIHWLQGFGRVAYSFQSSRYSFVDLASYADETVVPFADQIAKSAC